LTPGAPPPDDRKGDEMATKSVKLAIKTDPAKETGLGIDTANQITSSWFETSDLSYKLEMDHWLNDDSYLEQIDLSREEYIAAKTFIARMRGIKPEDEAKAA